MMPAIPKAAAMIPSVKRAGAVAGRCCSHAMRVRCRRLSQISGRGVEAAGNGEAREGREEQAKEQHFAAEPGAPPHLERAPRVSWTAQMKHRDVQGYRGDAKQGNQQQRLRGMEEQSDQQRAGNGLHQRGHEDEREVGVFRSDASGVDALQLGGGIGWQRDAGGRNGVPGGGHAGRLGERVVGTPGQHVNDLDLDGPFGAGVDACWFETIGKAAVAHIAFPHHAALFIELRNGVGAIPHAVLTADAGIGGMQHDAGHRILGVGIDGAAL